jgi:hypothetical protein
MEKALFINDIDVNRQLEGSHLQAQTIFQPLAAPHVGKGNRCES